MGRLTDARKRSRKKDNKEEGLKKGGDQAVASPEELSDDAGKRPEPAVEPEKKSAAKTQKSPAVSVLEKSERSEDKPGKKKKKKKKSEKKKAARDYDDDLGLAELTRAGAESGAPKGLPLPAEKPPAPEEVSEPEKPKSAVLGREPEKEIIPDPPEAIEPTPKATAKPARKGKISLPTSGTAEEILAFVRSQGYQTDHIDERLDEDEDLKSADEILRGAEIIPDVFAPKAPEAPENIWMSLAPSDEDFYDTREEIIEDQLQAIGIRIEQEIYGFNIENVREITLLSKITPVPNTADFIKGVINLRGIILPVIDLKTKFINAKTVESELTRVVILESGPRAVGVIVEEVDDVYTVPLSQIEEPPEGIVNISDKYVAGVARTDGPLIVMIDVEGLLDIEHDIE